MPRNFASRHNHSSLVSNLKLRSPMLRSRGLTRSPGSSPLSRWATTSVPCRRDFPPNPVSKVILPCGWKSCDRWVMCQGNHGIESIFGWTYQWSAWCQKLWRYRTEINHYLKHIPCISLPGWTVYILYPTDRSDLNPDLNQNRIGLFLSRNQLIQPVCHNSSKTF